MKIRIYIGDEAVETPDLDVATIFKLNDHLRKFSFKWKDGIKLDWRAIAYADELIDGLKEIINNSFIAEFKNKLHAVIDSIPDHLIENEYLFIAVKNYDYKKVLEQVKADLEIRDIESKNGTLQVAFLKFPIVDIYKVTALEILPEKLRRSLIRLNEEKRSVIIYSSGSTKIAVEIPITAPKELKEEIKKLGIIEYYVSIEGNEFEIRREKVFEEVMDKNTIIFFLPAYSIAFIPDIAAKFNYSVVNKVKIKAQLDFELKRSFDLYPHQKEAIELWNKSKKGTIVIPTGGGKTYIGMAAIDLLKTPTLILVPNKLLLWQWRDKLRDYLGVPEDEIGILGGGESKIRDITVSTYHSGVRNKEKLSKRFSLLICDESHHVPAKMFKEVVMYSAAPYRLALSATPKRYDKNEILLFKLMGPIVYEIKYQELVMMGILAPMVVRKILVRLPWDLKELYDHLKDKLDMSRSERERRRILNRLIEIARDNPNKLEVIKKIVEKHKNEKMFIFAGSIRFANMIAEEIEDIIPVAVLTAETPDYEEKKISKDFRESRLRALVLVKKGEEGLDVGDASVAIIAGGSKQVREFIQRVGRVLRGGRNKLAWVYEIVTINSVEEGISKARKSRYLVRGLEDFIQKTYGVRAYKVIKWPGELV